MRAIILGCALVVLTSTLAHAQAYRTWVSGVGDDANPCSRTAPCRTFAGAISKTLATGEINIIDAGPYGPVTIMKSISIIAEGFTAGVLAAGTHGIIISIPSATPSHVVVLRGLDINGVGTGLQGINILAAGAVHVDNCLIYGFTLNGIRADQPTPNSRVFVRNTYVHNTAAGLLVGQTVKATVDHFRSENNSYGIQGTLNARIHVRDSILSANLLGVLAGGSTQAMLRNTLVGHNVNTGVYANAAGAIVRFGNTTITGNTTGIRAVGGGQTISFGNNAVGGNGTDGTPTSTIPPM